MNRDSSGGDRTSTLLLGVGIGAALMYFLDPGRGARRRALLRDQAGSAMRSGRQRMQERAEDLRNRASGAVAEARGRLQDETVSDEQLVARVRSQLGHEVEHARAIDVAARDGTVTLRGQVARTEVEGVLAAVRGIRGVERVENELAVRQD
ncbi:MAG TPA: BON domain-containing protein [Gemmatimonadales bacterium]|nr:BON domain-containing protein [Gemmatimonadales bacterium]